MRVKLKSNGIPDVKHNSYATSSKPIAWQTELFIRIASCHKSECSTGSTIAPADLLPLMRSEIPSGMSAKLRIVAASNNRVHMPWSLCYCLFAPHICMVLFFTHIPFVVNHTINATPPETLQHNLAAFWRLWLLNLQGLVISVHMSFLQLKDIEQHGPTIGLRAACGPWKHSAKIFKSEIC